MNITIKKIVGAFFFLLVGFFCSAQSTPQVQVGCDCLHHAGNVTVTGNSEQARRNSADEQCATRIANIPGEEDISLHTEVNASNNEQYDCYAIHYVFGFGADDSSAKANARQTCSLLVEDSNAITSARIEEEGCKTL